MKIFSELDRTVETIEKEDNIPLITFHHLDTQFDNSSK